MNIEIINNGTIKTNNRYNYSGNKTTHNQINYLKKSILKKDNILQLLQNKINFNDSKINNGINIFKTLTKSDSDKNLKYKILLQEKDNYIHKLMNEIDYYKDCINMKLKKKYFDEVNKDKYENKKYYTIDNSYNNVYNANSNDNYISNNKIIHPKSNSRINIQLKYKTGNDFKTKIDIFKQKYDSMRKKKIKLINKKNKNYTMEKYEYDNNKKNSEKQSYSNTISDNKPNLISYSIIKEQNNIHKRKMENLQNRMNNLFINLFSILQKNKKSNFNPSPYKKHFRQNY